jgi:hypothetical protein
MRLVLGVILMSVLAACAASGGGGAMAAPAAAAVAITPGPAAAAAFAEKKRANVIVTVSGDGAAALAARDKVAIVHFGGVQPGRATRKGKMVQSYANLPQFHAEVSAAGFAALARDKRVKSIADVTLDEPQASP